jgi:hypothetical protein
MSGSSKMLGSGVATPQVIPHSDAEEGRRVRCILTVGPERALVRRAQRCLPAADLGIARLSGVAVAALPYGHVR